LIKDLKAGVLANFVITTHSDILEISDVPQGILFLPDTTPKRLDDAETPVEVKDLDAGTVKIYAPPFTFDCSFEVEILTDSTLAGLEYAEKLTLYLNMNPYLTAGGKEYPLRIDQPTSRPTRPEGNSNLRRIDATFTVEGVELDPGTVKDGMLVLERQYSFTNQKTGGTDQINKPVEGGN
jgi:hypothetical protein